MEGKTGFKLLIELEALALDNCSMTVPIIYDLYTKSTMCRQSEKTGQWMSWKNRWTATSDATIWKQTTPPNIAEIWSTYV